MSLDTTLKRKVDQFIYHHKAVPIYEEIRTDLKVHVAPAWIDVLLPTA